MNDMAANRTADESMLYRSLAGYWPEFMAAVREFREIAAGLQPDMHAAVGTVSRAHREFYLRLMGEYGVSRWESILHLAAREGDTLETRRFRVITLLTNQIPFTITSLKNKLDSLCGPDGYDVQLNPGAYTLDVKLDLTAKNMFEDVQKMLDMMVPANLTVTTDLKYNQHGTLRGYTHGELKAYTHYGMRNEVLSNG